MKFSRTLKLKFRPLFRALIRFLKYYSYQTHYVEGDGGELVLGKNVGLCNTLFNTESGNIHVGDNTIFGYNALVLTGTHIFKNGVRLSVLSGKSAGSEVPRHGRDINIGKNCWVASGAIIYGPCNIGDSVIIAAGSIVTGEVSSNSIIAGVPGRIVGRND